MNTKTKENGWKRKKKKCKITAQKSLCPLTYAYIIWFDAYLKANQYYHVSYFLETRFFLLFLLSVIGCRTSPRQNTFIIVKIVSSKKRFYFCFNSIFFVVFFLSFLLICFVRCHVFNISHMHLVVVFANKIAHNVYL